MSRLAVIVAQGGVNSAGRTSGFNAYKRIVYDALCNKEKERVIASLHQLCTSSTSTEQRNHAKDVNENYLLRNTLVRHINLLEHDTSKVNKRLSLHKNSTLVVSEKQMNCLNKQDYEIESKEGILYTIRLKNNCSLLARVEDEPKNVIGAALPTGFLPQKLYASRSHPKGLNMTVYGASDCIHSLGMDWSEIEKRVAPHQIAVYAGSSMGQMDEFSNGGLLQSFLKGERVSAKQLPFGFAEMPADFINAYLLGSMGSTGTMMGACASFLYNLSRAVQDIHTKRARIALVGNSEAPLTTEVVDGYSVMGAMATEKMLRKLDGIGKEDALDYRRACRPFSDNIGFVLGESAQFFILMDDQLALETGATIFGAVPDVFINADGYKKSISSPGVGNYITLARSVALGQKMFGSALDQSIVFAHGSGTPQNRVTESEILSRVAHTFDIERWVVSAIKGLIGHSLGTASGDQLAAALGVWQCGIVPGIKTSSDIAEDVHQSHLHFLLQSEHCREVDVPAIFLNAKGFGGNNASTMIISPYKTIDMLQHRYGNADMTAWKKRNEHVIEQVHQYEQDVLDFRTQPIYRFGDCVLDGADLDVSTQEIRIKDKVIRFEEGAYNFDPYFPEYKDV